MEIQLYWEMLPLEALHAAPFDPGSGWFLAVRQRLDDALASRGGSPVCLELVVRVRCEDGTGHGRRSDLETVMPLLRHPERWGLDRVRLWPQLGEAGEVYLNGDSQETFFARLHDLLDRLEAAACPLPPLLYDQEPPRRTLLTMTSGLTGAVRALGAGPKASQKAELVQLADGLAAHVDRIRQRYAGWHGTALPAAVSWQSAAVFPAGGGLLQRLYERWALTPTTRPSDGAPIFDAYEAMCYGSLVQYVLRPRRLAVGAGHRWVAHAAGRHVQWCRRMGATAGVLLGCTTTGLLGNEPVYVSPRELAAAARAAGSPRAPRLGVYEVRGLLAEPDGAVGSRDWRPWVDALLGLAE